MGDLGHSIGFTPFAVIFRASVRERPGNFAIDRIEPTGHGVEQALDFSQVYRILLLEETLEVFYSNWPRLVRFGSHVPCLGRHTRWYKNPSRTFERMFGGLIARKVQASCRMATLTQNNPLGIPSRHLPAMIRSANSAWTWIPMTLQLSYAMVK